ncbi:MAG: hypothetical protein AUH79_03260 [Betaproteobacteria bacterium 13_1_40CM_4_64_4]|nr:MAG: hypothetical protein AUH79_03260 [Betaproteobacteria bacterium 13_1_40CM_4_64_4]
MHLVAPELAFVLRRQGVVFGRERFTMSRFDEDTSAMRMRIAATPIELRKPEMGPQSKARGILVGVMLGAIAWAVIIVLGVAVWRWLS